MSFKQPNEWANVILAQSYANLKQETEEKSLKNLNKQIYKDELDHQYQQKKLQKEKITQEKQIETQIRKQKEEALKIFEEKCKLDKKKTQEELSLEYSSIILNKKAQKHLQEKKELNSDKNILESIKLQINRENIQKWHQKEKNIQSEQNFLYTSAKLKEDYYSKKKQAEKKMDQDLALQNIEKYNKREQDYKNFFEKIDKEKEAKKKVFDKVIEDTILKEKQKNEIFSS